MSARNLWNDDKISIFYMNVIPHGKSSKKELLTDLIQSRKQEGIQMYEKL